MQGETTGPLKGVTVIEMAGIGPVPVAGLMLSEMGADVIRIERIASGTALIATAPEYDLDRHGRSVLRLDLKSEEGLATLKRMVAKADVLAEGFRPGVMERLGLGPDVAQALNPGLIYARMTGFGQEGPLAAQAGHDLTYLAYTGLLHAIGPKGGKPIPPLNLAADFGGGTMFLLSGILAALFERSRSGKGQLVDVAMVDGASMLGVVFFGFIGTGFWKEERGTNLLDSGAPFYDTYETADGRYVAVACLEPQFFAEFCSLLPLDDRFAKAQYDKSLWPEMKAAIERRLREKTRDEWAALFEPTDACVAPVLTLAEAPHHPHAKARQAHVEVGPLVRPAPAPRLSRTGATPSEPAAGGKGVLERLGFSGEEVANLVTRGVVGE